MKPYQQERIFSLLNPDDYPELIYQQENAVKAIIEVKIRPERDGGFDKIARRLSRFPQVSSLYLMSGGFDLMVEVKG